jgi:hypothetical protein
LMRLLTADFETPSVRAAAEKPPFSTTATNTGIAPNPSIVTLDCPLKLNSHFLKYRIISQEETY